MKISFIFYQLFSIIFLLFTFSEQLLAAKIPPLYLSLKNSPKDFGLFANGGFDGNWYVGYNSMWIVELDFPKEPTFQRAFIGAKLGRAKAETSDATEQTPNSRIAIPCEIYMGIASTAAWKSSDSYFLTSCEDLPLEGIQDYPLSGIGEARWHWREIPLSAIRFGAKNYLGLWSASPELLHADRAPIVAAASFAGTAPAWLNRNIQGAPPAETEASLEIPLAGFVPALAVKLVPEASSESVHMDLVSFKEADDTFFWEIQVAATNLERVRPEMSLTKENWIAFGKSHFDPPFLMTVKRSEVTGELKKLLTKKKKVDQAFLRVTAWDEWGNSASTESIVIYMRL